MAVDSIGTSTATGSKTAGSLASLADNFDSFIKLLTAQLKNQDPTSPLETNEFTQQIIGFSQVQQSINTNANIEKLIEVNKNSGISSAVSYVDRFIQAETDTFNLKSQVAILSYDLPEAGKNVVINITDDTGKVYRSLEGTSTEGENKVVWDGNDRDGNPMKDGKYKIHVTAKNMNNADMGDIKTYSTELVSQVDLQGENIVLYIGDIEIPMSKVKSVKGYYSEV